MSMSTQTAAEVDTDDGVLSIDAFETDDETIVDHFEGLDADERGEELERVLKLGVETVGLASTTGEQEYVERKFEEMRSDFEGEIERIEEEVDDKFGSDGEVPEVFDQHLGEDGTLRTRLDDAFGEDGVFVERLDDELGEDGERIQDALDPDTDGTPTNRLRKSLKEEIDEVRKEVTSALSREEVRSKTTLSGDDFESDLDEVLRELVYMTPHEVDHTADEKGELEGRTVGDFVLTLGDTNQRIVIEAKSKDISKDKMKTELEESIQNRNADYGIIIFESVEYSGMEVGMFHEFDQQRLAISAKETDEENIDSGYIQIGFNWARTRLAQQSAEVGPEFDPESVQSSMESAQSEIKKLSSIQGKLTTLTSTVEDIRNDVKNAKEDSLESLAEAQRELMKADNS